MVAKLMYCHRSKLDRLTMARGRTMNEAWNRWGLKASRWGHAVVKAYRCDGALYPTGDEETRPEIVERCRVSKATQSDVAKALRSQCWSAVFQPRVMKPERRKVFAYGATSMEWTAKPDSSSHRGVGTAYSRVEAPTPLRGCFECRPHWHVVLSQWWSSLHCPSAAPPLWLWCLCCE